ncbi:MAG TPA: hypothetical protein VGS41_00285 [Chthonomonadales bacterium]|nr:hypothetical protein [Chthonomonadales bacterium]
MLELAHLRLCQRVKRIGRYKAGDIGIQRPALFQHGIVTLQDRLKSQHRVIIDGKRVLLGDGVAIKELRQFFNIPHGARETFLKFL